MNCTECIEKLVELLEGLLSEAQRQTVEEHLKDCQHCRQEFNELKELSERLTSDGKTWQQTDLEDAVFTRVIRRQHEKLKQADRINRQFRIWRIIMNKPITKLAAAAVIIIAVMIGINQFGGSVDMASVAWGKIAEKIEQFETVSYRMRTSIKTKDEKTEEGESVIRQSSQYGMQMDTFQGNKLTAQTYILLQEKEFIAIFHETKKYLRKELTEKQQKRGPKIEDPRKWLPSLLSENYQELGRKTIDGVEVEGIEVVEPQFCGRAFADCRVQLWVDVENELPVQVVSESIPSKSKMNIRTVFDDFQWDVELDSSVFQSPVIPDDYTEMQLPKGW